jgi:small-conductance mechanosensitive channel
MSTGTGHDVPDGVPMSDEHDNSDVWWLWGILIGLYFLINAIHALGWLVVGGLALALVAVPLLVWICFDAYVSSEFRRYRQARRRMKRILKWGRKRSDQVLRA